MILAISLNITDYILSENGEVKGDIVYTNKIATFEYEHPALDFATDKPHIMLIDCDSGKILQEASVTIEP